MLSTCGGTKSTDTGGGQPGDAGTHTLQKVEATTEGEQERQKPEATEKPDNTENQVIEHGAPDQSRNDSVKAAKTKGKF